MSGYGICFVLYLFGLGSLAIFRHESNRPFREARQFEIDRRIEKNLDRHYADRFAQKKYIPAPHSWIKTSKQ
jgi:hypothetical protein